MLIETFLRPEPVLLFVKLKPLELSKLSPGRFACGSFSPLFYGGSIYPFYVSGLARRSFSPWVVSHIVFYRGTDR